MSKVQEAIAKIRSKVRPNNTLSEQLRIPVQQEHESSLFPVEPSEVKSWLIAHGVSNTATSVKTLIRAVQHCNRTVMPPLQRLQTMEHFEKPFSETLQSLDVRYLHLAFPMAQESENAFQLAAVICQEMAYGYKIALVESMRTPGASLRKKHKQQCVSLALEHLSNLALRHAKIYRPWPNSFWQDTNTLYQIAQVDRTEKINNLTVKESLPQHDNKPLSISNQYARLCVLHLLNNNQYQAQQLQGLYTSLSRYSSELTLQTTQQGIESETLYCVGMNNPPLLAQFCHYQPSDKLAYFSIDNLVKKLNDYSPVANSQPIKMRSLHNRLEARAARDKDIEAVTGIKNIHKEILNHPPTDTAESQFTDLRELIAQGGARNTDLRPAKLGDSASELSIENESKHGYGLKISKANGQIPKAAAQVGELIGHSYKSDNGELSWYLGQIRWMISHHDKSHYLGVEHITQHANAVAVYRLQKDKQNENIAIDGLLANYQLVDSRAKMLLLPLHRFKPGETVGYRDSHGFNIVKLIECVERHGNFQCFAIITMTNDELSDPVATAHS